MWHVPSRVLTFEDEPTRIDVRPLSEGWQRAEGIVRIPDSVAILQLQAGVRGQVNDADAAWFNNAVLIRLR